MPYLYINVFRPGTPWQLNPDEAVIQLQQSFPEALVLPGDQLVRSALRAEQQLDARNPAENSVIEKLWWDAEHSGPAYGFYIPAGAEPRVDGVLKRYQADFVSTGAISEALHARITEFLRSLLPAGGGITVHEESDDVEPALPHS
jgi:hypothetical protein